MGSSSDKSSKDQTLNHIITPAIKSIKDIFCFTDEHIYELYLCFSDLDRGSKGYLQLDDFMQYFMNIDQDFVELPYLQRLFGLVEKEKATKMFYQEFLNGISIFCLLNNESILQFVFDFIDTDGDQRITKKDIIKSLYYRNPKTGNFTFFTNFVTEIEHFQMKQDRTDIEFDYFRLNSDKLMFLIWPGYRLQQRLREKLLGSNFWHAQYSKVQKKEDEIKNNEKKQQRMKDRNKQLKTLKMRKIDGPFVKQARKLRQCGQSGSDTKLEIPIERKRRRSIIYVKGDINFQIPQSN